MSDIIDTSNDNADKILAEQINHTRQKASQRELIPSGSCYYCSCSVGHGQLFCDSICRDDYQAEQDAIVRNGR